MPHRFHNIKFEGEGPFLILLKTGDVEEVASLDGGGIMIGEDPGFYEVMVTLPDGESDSYYQTEIAAILDTSDNRQVEFGSPRIAKNHNDHPRGIDLPVLPESEPNKALRDYV